THRGGGTPGATACRYSRTTSRREGGGRRIETESQYHLHCTGRACPGQAVVLLLEASRGSRSLERRVCADGPADRRPATRLSPSEGSGMAVKIEVPSVGEAVTEGVLSRWVKANGTRVSANEVVAEIETDKANNEVRAPAAGTLVVLVPEGQK